MGLSSPQLQPLDVMNLRDYIEQQVRNAVLNGTFKPGERIIETAIADQLSVSRAPVREALSALEREGLVINRPRRGYFVVDFTEKDIEEIYSLRLLLEVGALPRAIDRLNDQNIADMQRMVEELGTTVSQEEAFEAVINLDLSFHELICRGADHSRLLSAWNSMRWQTRMLIGLTTKTHYNHPDQPKELHQRILNAIVEKDLERAELNLTEHLNDAQQRARMALQSLRASDPDRSK